MGGDETMENKREHPANGELEIFSFLQNNRVINFITVHAIRVLTKLCLISALYYRSSALRFPLTIYIIISEILDQGAIFLGIKLPQVKKYVAVFYVINSVVLISTIAFFAKWVTNDFYLVYLIHISSATIAYGFRIGLLSYILSILVYSVLLYKFQAPLESYIRLPILSILAIRLFVSEVFFEKLNRIVKDIISVNKAKQDFITIASHNLRTPVGAIYGYIELLIRGDAGNLTDQQTTYIQRIKRNNQELEKLTEQLLQISILEVDKEVNLQKQPSQIEVIIEDIVENFAFVAKAKGLDLTFNKLNGLLPLTDIDVEKIQSVVLNLLDNAIKYTEKGGILVTAKSDNNFISVSIQDSGIGISQEDIPKLFNKFFRSGNLLVYNQTGTGLGLYISKRIIELHGGRMTVDSIVGRGTTFTFTLPVIKKDLFE